MQLLLWAQSRIKTFLALAPGYFVFPTSLLNIATGMLRMLITDWTCPTGRQHFIGCVTWKRSLICHSLRCLHWLALLMTILLYAGAINLSRDHPNHSMGIHSHEWVSMKSWIH